MMTKNQKNQSFDLTIFVLFFFYSLSFFFFLFLSFFFSLSDMEMRMLSNLHQKHWSKGLSTGKGFSNHREKNAKVIERMASLTENYAANCKEEETKTMEELANGRVGKVDPKKHLGQSVRELMSDNIDKCLVTMLNTVVF